MVDPVKYHSMEPRIRQNHLKTAPGSRVPKENGPVIPFYVTEKSHIYDYYTTKAIFIIVINYITMDENKIPEIDLQTMIADYMENGFLDNIIDMFRHDSSLYSIVGILIRDERVRVRIGTTAMMEELSVVDKANISSALHNILPLLDNENAVVRGDAANLLGIIGNCSVLPALRKAQDDNNQNVRILVKEAIEEIITKNGNT